MLRKYQNQYSPQFWLLFWGFLVNRASASLIWPFLTVFIRERLDLPLTTITLLFTEQAIAGLVSTSLIGPAMDRFGRKGVMLISLIASAMTLLAMSGADRLEQWVVLIAFYGAINPIFNIGANAMVADLVEPERRTSAYALMRMISNLGLAVGPAVGGFLIAESFALSYYITATVNLILAILLIRFIAETLPKDRLPARHERAGGYGPLLRDRPFMTFWALYVMVEMGAVLMFALLPVYVKENFGLPEHQFGLLVTVNGTMVVLFQYGVTRITQRFRPVSVMAVGALFYAVGVGSVAFGQTFPAFVMSMVIITIGELIVAPTSVTLVANLAPPDMRARYMGFYSLAYIVASGTGPVIGGFLSDHLAPTAIWYGGMGVVLVAAGCFMLWARLLPARIETAGAKSEVRTVPG